MQFRPSHWAYGLTILSAILAVPGFWLADRYNLRGFETGLGIALGVMALASLVLLLIGFFHSSRPGLKWKILFALLCLPVAALGIFAGGHSIRFRCDDQYVPGSPEDKAAHILTRYLSDHGFDTAKLNANYSVLVTPSDPVWTVGYSKSYCNLFGGFGGIEFPNVPTMAIEAKTLRVIHVENFEHGRPLNGWRLKK